MCSFTVDIVHTIQLPIFYFYNNNFILSPITFCPNPSFQLLYGRKRKRLEKTHEVENVKVENAKVEM